MKMQLPPNNFSIANSRSAYSVAQQRQGIVLNAPLPHVRLITRDIILAFYRFLTKSGLVRATYHEVGRGMNNESTIRTPILLAKFCPDLHESMRLLCEEGPIEFLAPIGSGAHSHAVSLKPSVNKEVVYSIGAKDREPPRVRLGGMIPDDLDILCESNAQVDRAGNEIFNPNKPGFRHVQNGEVMPINDEWGSPDGLKFPLKHFYEVFQNPERAIVKLRGRQLANLQLDRQRLPNSVIKGLNQISDALRQFDPNDEYIIDPFDRTF